MDPFNPAINYGPNDAGISAITLIIISLGLVAAIWAAGSLYGLISDFFSKDSNKNDKE